MQLVSNQTTDFSCVGVPGWVKPYSPWYWKSVRDRDMLWLFEGPL